MCEDISKALKELKKIMTIDRVDPTKGLPEDLFIFATTLVPIVNIDLFVTNEKHQLLLSWRNDIYYGKGWHIPGGCIRLRERLETRVLKTAEKELGVPIVYNPNPLTVREFIESRYRPALSNQMERCHNISFLYECNIKPGYEVPGSMDGVELRWFSSQPDDLLAIHVNLYGDIIESYFNGGSKND